MPRPYFLISRPTKQFPSYNGWGSIPPVNLDSPAKKHEKNQYLSNLLREELSKIPKIILYGPEDPNSRTSIVSFNIEGMDSQEVVDRLEKQNIILALREIMEKKIVRASPHFFNSESEILQVIDAIKKL